MTSFRCFEFGVKCDVDDRQATGLWPNCAPRESGDPKALLHPIARYTQLLRSLKWEEDFSVAVFAPPVEEDGVQVGLDEMDQPELAHTCLTGEGGTPAVRLKAFAEALHGAAGTEWALSPSCRIPNYGPAMAAMGERIVDALGDACAPAPPRGCTDIAAAFGYPGDGRACNDECVPTCQVQEVTGRGTQFEEQYTVASCLEVCADGPCPGNTDASLAYADGHPLSLDPSLPVPVCWHFTYDPACGEESRGAKLMLARRTVLPPRSITTAYCDAVTPVEYHCTDGLDNDGDCLTDAEDPDCL